LNLNQKRKKFKFGGLPVKPTDYQSNRPVNRSNRPVYRYEPFAQRILNLNLTWTGFRPNRSGIPVPNPAGLAGPVGNVNPARVYTERISQRDEIDLLMLLLEGDQIGVCVLFLSRSSVSPDGPWGCHHEQGMGCTCCLRTLAYVFWRL